MNKQQSAIVTMVVIASLVNSFGAVKKSKDIVYPVLGGFVVMILLLALAEADAKVAEMFAGAYAITCLLTNGTDLFTGISSAITSGKRFDPGPAGGAVAATGSAPPATYSLPTTQAPPVLRSV